MLRRPINRSQSPYRIFACLCSLTLLLLSGCAGNSAHSRESKGNPSVTAAFGQVRAALGQSGLPVGLATDLTRASNDYDAGNFCGAVTDLETYLRDAQAARQGSKASSAEDFYNRGRALRADILTYLPQGVSCNTPRFGMAPRPSLDDSSNQDLRATVAFGEPMLWTTKGNGEVFTQASVPGVESTGDQPGLPAVPIYRQLIAVPEGATPSIQMIGDPSIAETLHLHLYPVQPEAVDGPPPHKFDNPPFVKDEQAYQDPNPYPAEPCSVTPIGQYRDLQLAQVACAAAQYLPTSDTVRFFDSVRFAVIFTGGSGAFITQDTLDPFEVRAVASFTNLTLNSGAIFRYVRPSVRPSALRCAGEELLILTPQAFLPAANALAAWKRSEGLTTDVATVDALGGGYLSNSDIRALIVNDYVFCRVRPSYVLLLGDSDTIAPFSFTGVDDTIGTDYNYGVMNASAGPLDLPDIAVGRLPVKSLDQANTVVNKIIGYEKTPPNAPSFYQNATFAGYFQCCNPSSDPGREDRTFIQTAEFLRNALLGNGYTVQRIYNSNTGHELFYTGDTTPREFYDGTALPADLGPGSGFGWNGSTADITSAFAAGRFLIFHRDHGWNNEWENPYFGTSNAGGLSNGSLLPVVFSVNCESGLFDNESNGGYDGTTVSGTYFAEALLRDPNGGAVGVIGDTRSSPSSQNSLLAKGFFDAIWPDTLAFGGTTAQYRLGDILNHGKAYLLSVDTSDRARDELYLYHVLGDPSMQIRTTWPYVFKLPMVYFVPQPIQIGDPAYQIQYASQDGTELTAYQIVGDTVVPVARGVVENGAASLTVVAQPNPQIPLQLSARMDDGLSVALPPITVGAKP